MARLVGNISRVEGWDDVAPLSLSVAVPSPLALRRGFGAAAVILGQGLIASREVRYFGPADAEQARAWLEGGPREEGA